MIVIDLNVYKNLPIYDEVKSANAYSSSKFERFHPEGLYSEQIFGPAKDYRCQCGETFGKINSGKRCENCGVLCDTSDLRTKTFAKIKLPSNIFVINPDFIGNLNNIFGTFAVKNILSKSKYNENREIPYKFSLEKFKLTKVSKLKENEKVIDFEIFDITTLKKLFDMIREIPELDEWLKNQIKEDYIDYIFINEIPVIPPSSRPIVKIGPNKFMPHAITALYTKLLTSKKNISDALFQENSQLFGFTVYKYQEKIFEIYDKIAESNFKKKESYIRESLTGKTVEFSQRAIIVPNPAIKPYQIGIHKESVEKLFLPEMLRFLFEKFENEKIEGTDVSVLEYLQYIYNSLNDEGIELSDELFLEFLEKYIGEFRTVFERQPVLFKYNTVGTTIGRVFGDNDLFWEKEK